ncbi:MAG TPA: SIMPL domain-containing protein [Bryobacteraceae bacterium]|nr:SIMPL domain-containing protein [Bryobacteraceae bacterium]
MLFALCGPVFGQSDAITVTVSRNVDLPPDGIYFSLAVATDPDLSLDQVLQASQALGLSAQNLTSVTLQQYGPSSSQTRLAYAFDLTVPFSSFKETNDKLAAVRRTMAANTPPMDLQVYSIAVSPSETARDQARQGLLSSLFENARQRADQLAKAAEVTLGGIVGVSEAWANAGGYPYYGPFGGPIGPTTLKTAFSLTVRYAVK